VPVPEEQEMSTTRFFTTPKQGSPNVVVLGKTTQLFLPKQEEDTIEVEFAALQEPI
jgi:hypothetical protein